MPNSTAIPDSPTSSSQCIIEPSSLYLDQLHKHFESTRLHVTGERTANYIYDHAHPSDGPLYASLYPPNAYWTAEEKNTFFHSLSVRSRLRPDLIAEDIKTKTIVDVCVYLGMLEKATLDISRNEVESKHKRGSRRKRGRDANPRRALPIAMEMSDQWCLFEEQQARLVVEAENRIQLCSVEELHCAEIEEKRVSLRVKPGDGKDEAGKRDRLGQRFRRKELDAWIDEQREDWEWEKRLNGLDYDTLTIMDRILRDAEDLSFGEPSEVDEEQSKGVEEAERHQNLTLEDKSNTLDKTKLGPQHLTPEAEQIDGTIEAASLPIQIPSAFIQSSTDVSSHMQAIPSQTMVQSTFDESMIDPALLALSVQPPISRGAPMTRPNTPPLQTGLNHSSLSFNPITPPFAAHSSPSTACATLPSVPTTDVESTCAEEASSRPTRAGSRRIVRSSALASSPATSNIDLPNLPTPDMRALSPASRKRLRKRMYMRRKRAEKAGIEVNLEMGRLKPGRKSTKIAKTSRRNSQGEEENDGDDEEDGDGNEGEESGVEGTAEGVRSLPVGVKATLIVAEKSTRLEATATPTVPAEIPESVIEPQKPTDKFERGDVTEVVETDQEFTRRSYVSGVTKPYRIRKELEEKGIDAEWLKSQGLDMFHLGTVHKLMQMYNQMHEVPPDVISEISSKVIKTLRAYMILFVYSVTKRALLIAEEERKAKMHTKVWRLGDSEEVTAIDVRHALKLVGMGKLDRRKHFKTIFKRLGVEHPHGTEGSSSSPESSDEEPSSDETDGSWVVSEDADDEEYEEGEDGMDLDDEDEDTQAWSDNDPEDVREEKKHDAVRHKAELIKLQKGKETRRKHNLSLLRTVPIHRKVMPPCFRIPTYRKPFSDIPKAVVNTDARKRPFPLTQIPWSLSALSPNDSVYLPETFAGTSSITSQAQDVVPEEDSDIAVIDDDDTSSERSEDELDALDEKMENKYEKQLWAQFAGDDVPDAEPVRRLRSRKRKRQVDSMDQADNGEETLVQVPTKRRKTAVTEDNVEHPEERINRPHESGAKHSLRFKQPGGHVKSQVYVVDSD